MDLQGKVAVVTGVSKGIGRAVAEALLAKGAIVAGWGMHKPDFEHINFYFFETNVRDHKSVEHAFQQTQKKFDDYIHVLVNNAGLGYFGNFEDMTIEQVQELFEVNVYGIFYTCRHIIPVMKENSFGHIINISSTAGLEGMPQVAAYCGAKHAVRGISESLFRELRDFGIKVTTVYPGSTKTDFFRNSPGIKAHDNMVHADEVAEQIIRALETSDNFVINHLEFRPLQPKPKKN
jgi:NAD(P)-dependent dehydrogenase (short-subunit alcohol dehydrogenase family)